MPNKDILAGLNEQQHLAVSSAIDQNSLILAGAGSGKTKVLVHRIAYLIKEKGISPHGVLAVTFTNKASNEMRMRVEDQLNTSVAASKMVLVER